VDIAGEQFEIQPGEKFACMALDPGLRINCSGQKRHFLGSGCWVSEDLPFKLDELDEWLQCQLGKFVSEQVKRSPFVLTAKAQSAQPENFDTENETLCARLRFLLWGIAITAGVPLIEVGHFFSGGRTAEQVDLRNSASVESLYRTPGTTGTPEPTATIEDLRKAVRFTGRFEKIDQAHKADNRLYYRLVNGLGAFDTALKAHQAAAKHHQFVRTIESFLPREKHAQQMGNRRFAEQVKRLLARPGCKETPIALQQIYKLRSAAEHHLPFDQTALPGVKNAEEVAMQRTRQAEALARELYRRFLAENEDCLQHFNDDSALNSLWSNTAELKRIWGNPFDVHAIA
jgi:hypothetical protein